MWEPPLPPARPTFGVAEVPVMLITMIQSGRGGCEVATGGTVAVNESSLWWPPASTATGLGLMEGEREPDQITESVSGMVAWLVDAGDSPDDGSSAAAGWLHTMTKVKTTAMKDIAAQRACTLPEPHAGVAPRGATLFLMSLLADDPSVPDTARIRRR